MEKGEEKKWGGLGGGYLRVVRGGLFLETWGHILVTAVCHELFVFG